MIPAYARPAHRRLRAKLAEIAAWNDQEGPNQVVDGDATLGIITSGISFQHVREAAPTRARAQARPDLSASPSRPSAASPPASAAASSSKKATPSSTKPRAPPASRSSSKPEMYRFGELNVERVRRILAGDTSPEAAPPAGKPPELCPGCPHRTVFEALHALDCIVAGDIGCYTLGVLPPFSAMDTCVCMGAAIGVGLGLRHVLPPEQARRVVSVIGDSTFVHSGITGLVEMVYNPPPTGHVLLILDNGTTAMTGLQEHPGTGRRLNHEATGKLSFEELARSLGVKNVHVFDPIMESDKIPAIVAEALAKDELSLIIARRPCLLAAGAIKIREKAAMPPSEPTNVVIAGLGGQGVLKARTSSPPPRSAPVST